MSELQRAGSYVLLKKIAAGGMAELYKAKKSGEKGFEKLFAVKMILPHLAEDEEFISMLVDEAKVVSLLDHPNIVRIYDLEKTENSYCIVMEYVRGRDLRKVLTRASKSGKPLGLKDACYITASALAGLHNAHKKKSRGQDLHIVHRDISPQNIIVSYEGEVKVLDFGIAKAANKSVETRAGVLKGKVAYMSPEQARGKPLDARSDIFSTGIVLYELLAGRKLFSGDSDINTLKQVWAARVDPLPTEVNHDVPKELEGILLKSLARDPAARFQDAGEMEDALLGFMRREGFSSDANSLGRYMRGLFKPEFEAETKEDEELYGEGSPEEAKDEAPEAGPAQPEAAYTMTKTPLPGDAVFEEAVRQAVAAQAEAQSGAEPSVKPAPEANTQFRLPPELPREAPDVPESSSSPSPQPPPSSPMKGRLAVAALALALVVTGAWFGLRRGGNAEPTPAQPGVEAVPQETTAPAVPAARPSRKGASKQAKQGKKPGRQADTSGGGVEAGQARTGLSPVPDRAIEPAPARGSDTGAQTTRSRTRAAISSEPTGATVYLDGRNVGTTPLDLDAIDAYHKYAVKVSKDGYDAWSGEFSVYPGQTERVYARLTKSSSGGEDIWKDPFPKSPGRNRSR